MHDRRKKWLLWISLIVLVISILALVFSNTPTKSSYIINILCLILIVLSLLNPIILFSIKFQDRKWLITIAKFTTFLLPFFILGGYLLRNNINDDLTGIFLVIIFLLSSLISLIYLFIIREAGEIKGVLILLFLTVLTVILPLFFSSLNQTKEFFLPVLVLMTVAGMYMFGFRCLFILEKNLYLKTISFIACSITVIGGCALLLILDGGQAYILEIVYFVPAFLLTLVVLLTLPISGYINWISLHKRIMKKILVLWMLFLLIFSIHFLFPEYFRIISRTDNKLLREFLMIDYKLENKNGLEHE
jgi:hypothetical protein